MRLSHAKQVCLKSARSFDIVVNDKSEEAAEASTKHLRIIESSEAHCSVIIWKHIFLSKLKFYPFWSPPPLRKRKLSWQYFILLAELLRCRICFLPLELWCPGVIFVQRNLRRLPVESVWGKNNIALNCKQPSLLSNMINILVSLKTNSKTEFSNTEAKESKDRKRAVGGGGLPGTVICSFLCR